MNADTLRSLRISSSFNIERLKLSLFGPPALDQEIARIIAVSAVTSTPCPSSIQQIGPAQTRPRPPANSAYDYKVFIYASLQQANLTATTLASNAQPGECSTTDLPGTQAVEVVPLS